MDTAPLLLRYDGDGSFAAPRKYWAEQADKHYVIGQIYQMAELQERSMASHRAYFAAIREGWLNLREPDAERFPSEEHLRKWALVQAGYADERSIVCSSKAEAQRLAAFIKPMDQYAVVVANGPVVKVFTAQSQSMRAMDRKTFEASKQKVLDIICGLIGATPDDLARNARSAA